MRRLLLPLSLALGLGFGVVMVLTNCAHYPLDDHNGNTCTGSDCPPGDGGTCDGSDCTPPGDSGCSGSDCNPPGDSGTPPGDSGTPPGDSGTPPGDSGTPPGDSGTPPGDSGTPPGDAGTGSDGGCDAPVCPPGEKWVNGRCVCDGGDGPPYSHDKCGWHKTLICHHPRGNDDNWHEICVGNAAIHAHLQNHGDTLGLCP